MKEAIDLLIVDDEPDICWALEVGLGEEGYRITRVTREEEALREVERRSFALAIVDAKLPGRSGIELSKLMRRQDPRLKILLLSGYYYEDDQLIQQGIEGGDFNGFISKPFELDEVSALVKRLVGEDP